MNTHQEFDELQRRAEEYLQQAQPVMDEGAYADIQSLLHDLHVHQIELTLQNEELRRVQQELEASRNRYADLYDFAPLGYLTVAQSGLIVQANRTCSTMFGRERTDVLKLSLAHLLAKEDQDMFYLHRKKMLDTRRSQAYDLRMRRKDDSCFWAHLECTPVVDENNDVTQIRIAITDVSELKQMQEELRKRLAEREVLLKEVYHRVKNNFMTVSSLLSLQKEASEDPRIREVLEKSTHRVRSMSLIHERLYQADNLAAIDFGEVLYELTGELFQAYGTAASRIRLRTTCDPVLLTADKAIPCSMLVNELVSNALKYAFPGGRGGEIRLELHEQEQHVILVIADNGVGLPENLDLPRVKSLGLELAQAFIRQLQGTFALDLIHGTTFTITFPK